MRLFNEPFSTGYYWSLGFVLTFTFALFQPEIVHAQETSALESATMQPSSANGATTQELDAYWDELSRTVDAGDFEGYKVLYHADAVMVNEISGSTYPIGAAFAGWKAGFDDTKAGDMDAEVTFRFSNRFIDDTTAFETGIFRYVAHPVGEEPSVSLIHFDALTIKQDGSWVMMMERQISIATQQEWDALDK
ncbi:MAG: nuclear transport factor 2 family protein [Bacteroidetes bacterium]|nr:nuclear transport factor 2 family protein [Bacteroidota bacterium]MDA0907477.1 nuclear transport factor 2 family protein [Bacteroidota bacterium]